MLVIFISVQNLQYILGFGLLQVILDYISILTANFDTGQSYPCLFRCLLMKISLLIDL